MKRRFAALVIGCAVAAAGGACSPQASAPAASPAREDSPAGPPAREVLSVYDETANGIPIASRYPSTMQVAGGGSGEGVGVSFTFVPRGGALDDAEVHVFLPSGATSAAELEPFVTGPGGLMASNGWVEDRAEAAGQGRFDYPWVRKVIGFRADEGQSGRILLGETHGQAVRVMLRFPTEMADAYWPAATTVLDNLSFDGGLLPIRSSRR